MTDMVMARVCGELEARNRQLRAALTEIESTPYSMVNDAESLRHTIKVIQSIARAALATAKCR